jgi:hypothetical protein
LLFLRNFYQVNSFLARKLVETENCFITDQEFNQLILDV